MWDKARFAISECNDPVIHPLEMQRMEIDEIPRYMKSIQLPLSFAQILGTRGKPFDDQTTFMRLVASMHDVLVVRELHDPNRQLSQRLL